MLKITLLLDTQLKFLIHIVCFFAIITFRMTKGLWIDCNVLKMHITSFLGLGECDWPKVTCLACPCGKTKFSLLVSKLVPGSHTTYGRTKYIKDLSYNYFYWTTRIQELKSIGYSDVSLIYLHVFPVSIPIDKSWYSLEF